MSDIPESLKKKVQEAFLSCRTLFPDPEKTPPLFRTLLAFLSAVLTDRFPDRRLTDPGTEDDALTFLDSLTELSQGMFCRQFDHDLTDILTDRFPCLAPGELTKDPGVSDAAFTYAHIRRMAESLRALIPDYLVFLRQASGMSSGELTRLRPSYSTIVTDRSLFLRLASGAVELELRKNADRLSAFGNGRVFRHRDGCFQRVELDSIRHIEDFYGYHDARKVFLEHFGAFAEGRSNLPLLISSLPGLGKTQMTIAHTLHFPELILILPDPADISTGLEDLIRRLALFPDKKFMVFFDDIDTSVTDWFYFRSHIGGTFSLPENITITIASNQRFPANISSRGRGFEFPIFDEVRCQEMVADFLAAHGVKEPSPDLTSVIASDYVEEFGQKMFEELSPRTLVRYLHVYETDAAKRKQMIENSRNELITQPDAQVFYDENVKLMRSIYGDSVLEELREKAYHGHP